MSKSSSDLSIYIEFHNSEEFNKLVSRLELLEEEIQDLKFENQRITLKYGYEVHMNSELIDICKRNNVDFRPALEHRGDLL